MIKFKLTTIVNNSPTRTSGRGLVSGANIGPQSSISIGATDPAVKALVEAIKEKSYAVRAGAERVLNKYMLRIQSAARRALNDSPTRIDEGTLRASIQVFLSAGLNASKLGAYVFTDSDYAKWVHWGTGIYGTAPEGGHRLTPWVYFDEKRQQFFVTRGMEANPFLLKAFNLHYAKFVQELREVLDPSLVKARPSRPKGGGGDGRRRDSRGRFY